MLTTWCSGSSTRPTLSDVPGAGRTLGKVRVGVAPGQDAAAGIRSVRGRELPAPWASQARHVRFPGFHAYLREDQKRTLYGGAANHAQAVAGQTGRGESRTAAAYARPCPGGGQVAARGG